MRAIPTLAVLLLCMACIALAAGNRKLLKGQSGCTALDWQKGEVKCELFGKLTLECKPPTNLVSGAAKCDVFEGSKKITTYSCPLRAGEDACEQSIIANLPNEYKQQIKGELIFPDFNDDDIKDNDSDDVNNGPAQSG